jgi:hypothetical protein
MAVHYVAACICRDVIVCSFACQHMCEWKCSLGIVTACRVSIHLTPWPVTHNINWWWPFYLLFPTPSLFLFFSPTTTLFKAPHLRLYPFLCLAARGHISVQVVKLCYITVRTNRNTSSPTRAIDVGEKHASERRPPKLRGLPTLPTMPVQYVTGSLEQSRKTSFVFFSSGDGDGNDGGCTGLTQASFFCAVSLSCMHVSRWSAWRAIFFLLCLGLGRSRFTWDPLHVSLHAPPSEKF